MKNIKIITREEVREIVGKRLSRLYKEVEKIRKKNMKLEERIKVLEKR